MPLWNFQSNFNRGELDPLLVGRIDIQAYYNGMREATNVLTIPQGGVKRRPGQDFLGAAYGDGRIENFSFNVEQNYLLVFTDMRMQIYKDGVLQTNINGGSLDYVDTPWTLEQLKEFDYIQSADTAIVTQVDVAPHTITRTSDTDWAVTAITLEGIPELKFADGSAPIAIEIQKITFTSANEGDRYKLSLEGILTDELIFGGDQATNQTAIQEALLGLANTANKDIGVSALSLTEYQVSFFGDNVNDWDLISGTPILTKDVENFAINTTRIQAGASGKEPVWSATRGWPKTCTFHEGRLYFGGSKSRPATLWGSNINDFFNFSSGRSRDDEGIDVTLDTDQVNAIEAIFSNRSLQIFTSGAEFYVRESPVTPTNIAVVPQTNLGSRRIRPVSVDGLTLFAQRTGKVINQFVFINEFQANQTTPISSLSAHLINKPVKMSVSRGTDSTDANYVYILNDDGSLTVFNTLISEDVQAFTSWSSAKVKSIAVVSDKLNLLIEREVDGQTVYYVEVESDTALTDSAVTSNVGGSPTLTGLDHLEGEEVDVKADGSYQGKFTVTGGEVTIPRDADTIEAGLSYSPVVQTMPLNVGLQNGPNAASKKKILRVAVNQFESNGIIIDGQRLADKTIGLNQFDAPSPQTGVRRITLLGWSLEANVTVTQDTPFPMTLLSLGLEVKE